MLGSHFQFYLIHSSVEELSMFTLVAFKITPALSDSRRAGLLASRQPAAHLATGCWWLAAFYCLLVLLQLLPQLLLQLLLLLLLLLVLPIFRCYRSSARRPDDSPSQNPELPTRGVSRRPDWQLALALRWHAAGTLLPPCWRPAGTVLAHFGLSWAILG